MNFFGVGPLELFFILILGLIVLGPERLPEMGRFIGRKMAQLMAWQQQSPEAQMIQQIRQDFNQEIVELRDELVRARAQFNVNEDMQKLRDETRAMLSLKDQEIAAARAANPVTGETVKASQAPNKITAEAPVNNAPAAEPATAADLDAPAEPGAPADAAQPSTIPDTSPPRTVARGRPDDSDPEWAKRKRPDTLKASASSSSNGASRAAPASSTPAATSAEVQALQAQIEALMLEIHDLHAQLRHYQSNGTSQDAPTQLLEYK